MIKMTRFQGNLASVATNELIKWRRVPLEGEFDAFMGTLGKLEIKVHQRLRVSRDFMVDREYSLRARRMSSDINWDGEKSTYTPCAYLSGREAQRVYEKLDRII